MVSMKCPQCGAENSDSSSACIICGNALNQPQNDTPNDTPPQAPNQSNPYQAQSNPHQAQPNAYQAQPNAYQAQPNSYQAPPNSYQGPVAAGSPGDKPAKTSLICGIIGLVTTFVCCCIPFVGTILGIIALIQANKAKKLGSTKATVGTVLGILAIVFSVLMLIYMITLMASSTFWDAFYTEMERQGYDWRP